MSSSAGAIGYSAHLRVYQPLAAFGPDERARWTAYVDSGDAPSRPVLMAREHSLSLAAALAVPPRLTVASEEHAIFGAKETDVSRSMAGRFNQFPSSHGGQAIG